ncbi:ABC transporter ATP-binding protein [Candidatus Hydrogenedentota bacterium]
MITISGLTKKYGEQTAVDDLDLNLKEGEFYSFLGPNGAGKTTTIKILTGLLHPTGGSVSVAGHDVVSDPVSAKRLIGYIPDQPFLYEKLTGREFLGFVGQLYSQTNGATQARMAELMELFHVADIADQLMEDYSHGMRQKFSFCSALLHEPRVMIIDEPWVGLDPKSIRFLKNYLKELTRSHGTTVFMSTHTLSIAEEVSDRIGIIHQGKLIAEGSIDEIKELQGDERLEEAFLKVTSEED